MQQMDNNNESKFDEINLRLGDDVATMQPEAPRPQSTSKKIPNFLRFSFRSKKRRFTTPIAETDLIKNSISSPANCSRVTFSETDIQFSRNSIQCCPFDISGYGVFLLMDEFKVKKPKKMTLMVFLFEKIIIFTQKQPDAEAFYYIGSLKMDRLGLSPPHKNKKILEVKDHLTSVRFHKDTVFSLEAASEYIQTQWRKTIEKCLWFQLLKAKKDGELGKP